MASVALASDVLLPAGDDCLGLLWDPLREQDWESLSNRDGAFAWDMALDTHSIDIGEGPQCEDGSTQPKVSLQFSPVAIDTVADCSWDSVGYIPGGSLPHGVRKQHLTGPLDELIRSQQATLDTPPPSWQVPQHLHDQEWAAHEERDFGADSQRPAKAQEPPRVGSRTSQRSNAGRTRVPRIPSHEGSDLIGRQHGASSSNSRSSSAGTEPPDGGDTALFTMQLFVTAIADGHIAADTPEKTAGVLEQV